MPNKLSRFWQELKRRNVVRVITVYAASAFVILELVDILAPSLGLPDWTLNLVLILLVVGFIIAVIVSWIYDIHPEDGIVKTEPAEEAKAQDIQKSSSGWKIASYISFVVIVGLIVLNVIPRAGKKEILDKSIAVIPFESLSDDPEKQYQADGVMDAILLHLSRIEDLRVISRTSVEQYRGTDKTVNQICDELDVAYLLEGSFRRYGDQARLIVQLIQPGREEHIWANNYDRDWVDIFSVESEVAQEVARELKAVITPEVRQQIEKIPTNSLTAYDYYQRGSEALWKYASTIMKSDPLFLEDAKKLYQQALSYDPSFAQVYAGLAEVYYEQYVLSGSLSSSHLDSAHILADRAISLDYQNVMAHAVNGYYYLMIGDDDMASREFETAVELNPRDLKVYITLGFMYFYNDIGKAIYYYKKAASLASGTILAEVYGQLSLSYIIDGFEEKGVFLAMEALRLGGDSISYYYSMIWLEFSRDEYANGIVFCDDALAIDPENPGFLISKGLALGLLGHYKESIECYEKVIEKGVSHYSQFSQLHRIAFSYWQIGENEKAVYYFDQMIAFCDSIINLGHGPSQQKAAYYDLAATYAFLGDKDRALYNLREYKQKSHEINRALLNWMKEADPLFGTIRNEPEFQEILAEIEVRYQEEYERRRQWLEENDML